MPDTKVIETLKAARELISVPERWTQGEYARGVSARPVAVQSRYAVCWCAKGALNRVQSNHYINFQTAIVLERAMGSLAIGKFNDTHSHGQVLAAFDKAIELAEKEASHG